MKEPGYNPLHADQGDDARKFTKASFEGPRGTTIPLPRILGSRVKDIECGRGIDDPGPITRLLLSCHLVPLARGALRIRLTCILAGWEEKETDSL